MIFTRGALLSFFLTRRDLELTLAVRFFNYYSFSRLDCLLQTTPICGLPNGKGDSVDHFPVVACTSQARSHVTVIWLHTIPLALFEVIPTKVRLTSGGFPSREAADSHQGPAASRCRGWPDRPGVAATFWISKELHLHHCSELTTATTGTTLMMMMMAAVCFGWAGPGTCTCGVRPLKPAGRNTIRSRRGLILDWRADRMHSTKCTALGLLVVPKGIVYIWIVHKTASW